MESPHYTAAREIDPEDQEIVLMQISQLLARAVEENKVLYVCLRNQAFIEPPESDGERFLQDVRLNDHS
jgi:hypothetical protein